MKPFAFLLAFCLMCVVNGRVPSSWSMSRPSCSEQDVEICASDKFCKNGGVCDIISSTCVQCLCVVPWGGTHCDVKMTEDFIETPENALSQRQKNAQPSVVLPCDISNVSVPNFICRQNVASCFAFEGNFAVFECQAGFEMPSMGCCFPSGTHSRPSRAAEFIVVEGSMCHDLIPNSLRTLMCLDNIEQCFISRHTVSKYMSYGIKKCKEGFVGESMGCCQSSESNLFERL